MSAVTTAGPLAGVRVLDFSRFLSGPHCTRSMADMGADVIKVEPPEGDFTRVIPPHVGPVSRFFSQQNAGKRSVCVDLRHPELGEVIRHMLPEIDVVVENFRPGVMAAMGLDYESCRRINPRLVYVSISGWGQTGPDSHRAAFAVVVHAEAGFVFKHMHAQPSTRPVSDPFSHADVYSGLEALAAVLAALYQRQNTGRGQHIDIAMMSTALYVNEHASAEFDPDWSPANVNRAPILDVGDETIALVMDPVEPVSFKRLVALLGRPELASDPRFSDQPSREAHRDELMGLVEEHLTQFEDFEAVEQAFAEFRIAVGRVQTARQLAATEWAEHRRAVTEVADAQGGAIRIPDSPWRFSEASATARGKAPLLGEHNADVLSQFGFDAAEIAGFVDSGLLRSADQPAGDG